MVASATLKRYLLAFLAVVNLLVLFHFGLGALDLLKLAAAVIIGTLVPGLLVLHGLKLYPDTFYRFILAFMIGISLDILIFIIFSWLNLRFVMYFLLGIVFIIYMGKGLHKSDWQLVKSSLQSFTVRHFTALAGISLLVLGLIVAFLYSQPIAGC